MISVGGIVKLRPGWFTGCMNPRPRLLVTAIVSPPRSSVTASGCISASPSASATWRRRLLKGLQYVARDHYRPALGYYLPELPGEQRHVHVRGTGGRLQHRRAHHQDHVPNGDRRAPVRQARGDGLREE